MSVSIARVAELERQLEEARAQVAKEDGERYRIILRHISDDEKARILEGLNACCSGSRYQKSQNGALQAGLVPAAVI